MSYLMFIDESGQDLRESPYEVLAGIVVQDRDLWNLITAIQDAEVHHFGMRYAQYEHELKAKKLLKTKVFRHAQSHEPFDEAERTALARTCLEAGAGATPEQYAALAQAKLAFVSRSFELAAAHHCVALASIIPKSAPRPAGDFLRKDYSFLFERFYYVLRARPDSPSGLIVFDELERSQSHVLIEQMSRYFLETLTGRRRASQIVPEPFFVHSHLTTGVQLADLVAYVISWGVREPGMTEPARPELAPYAAAVCALKPDLQDGTRRVWPFNLLRDLRPQIERDAAGDQDIRPTADDDTP